MRNTIKPILTLLAAVMISATLMAQQALFADAGQNTSRQTSGKREIFPQKFRGFTMDADQMRNFLWTLPSEQAVMNRSLAPIMLLPMPDGSLAHFRVRSEEHTSELQS